MLREYPLVPGMGETTARAFRDKLAMRRLRPQSRGFPAPLSPSMRLNHAEIDEWTRVFRRRGC